MTLPLDALELDRRGETAFTAASVPLPGGRPVFGGQLLGQVVMAAGLVQPGKYVRTVQVVFPRTGDPARPLELAVEPVHVGQTMATLTVAVTQGERQVCRATVLMDSDEPDVLRHATAMPDVGGPEDAAPGRHVEPGSELRIVGGVDVADADAVGPPELHAWVRWPEAPPGDRARNAAIAAWYTDNLLIAAAMRPHAGIGEGMAHESLSTGVVSHTLTYHEPFDAAQWHLVVNESTFGGGGRVYGTGRIHTLDGTHVASFVQDAMVRAFPEYVTARGATSGVM